MFETNKEAKAWGNEVRKITTELIDPGELRSESRKKEKKDEPAADESANGGE